MPQVISQNSFAAPAVSPATVLQLVSQDGVFGAEILHSFADPAIFYGTRANGTNANPTTLHNGDNIVGYSSGGYGIGLGYTFNTGGLFVIAAGDWSAAQTPTAVILGTVALGKLGPAVPRFQVNQGAMLLDQFGNPPTGGDPGSGKINAVAYETAGLSNTLIAETEVQQGSAIVIGNVTNTDIATINIPAGEWDVWGTVGIVPAAGTTVAYIAGWINTVSATEPPHPGKGADMILQASFTTGSVQVLPVGRRRLSLSSASNVYLSCNVSFGVSTCAAFGYLGAIPV